MEEEKLIAGKCPKCGNKNLDYDEFELEGKEIIFPFTCLDCGFAGTEGYNLTFYGYYGKDGKEYFL